MFAERSRILLRCVLAMSILQAINCQHSEHQQQQQHHQGHQPRQHLLHQRHRHHPQQQQLRRVCYFTNWSCDLLVKEAYFCLRHLDPGLCSHIIFAFAGVNVTSLSLSPTRVDEQSVGDLKGRYIKFNDIKRSHPGLKTLLSAGGSYQAEKFKNVTSTATWRGLFARNTARYVRQWGFDGLDLDWEYPGQEEKEALTQLVKDLKSAFREEAASTDQQELLLSIAVPVGEERVRLGYQVDLISREADMINLMAYDFYYGAWTITAFNSPLYPRNHSIFSRKHSVEWIVNLWINLGAPPHKINLGIAGYGQSFTLEIDRRDNPPSQGQTGHPGTPAADSQANGIGGGTELDEKKGNANMFSGNSSRGNNTHTNMNNDVLNSVNGNSLSMARVNASEKISVTCVGALEDCHWPSSHKQGSRNKRRRRDTLSQDLSRARSTGDTFVTGENSIHPGLNSHDTNYAGLHANWIGNSESNATGKSTLDINNDQVREGETLVHKTENKKLQEPGTAVYAGNGSQQMNTSPGVYEVNGHLINRTEVVVLHGVGSRAAGQGKPGRLRHLKGQLSYPEICEMVQAGATVAWDSEQRVPFAVLMDQWVGYDNPRSVAEKVTWAFEQGLGGVMFWSLDLDDFKGEYCNQGRFPLLTSMSETVISLARQNINVSEHTGYWSHESHQDHGTDTPATSVQMAMTTPVSRDNYAKNRPTPLPKDRSTAARLLVTTTASASQQTIHNGQMSYTTPYVNTKGLSTEFGTSSMAYFTRTKVVGSISPTNVVKTSRNKGSTTAFQNTIHEDKQNIRPNELIPSGTRTPSKKTDFVPFDENRPIQTTNVFPSNRSKHLESTDIFTSDKNKQFETTNGFLFDKNGQFEPTNGFPVDKSRLFEPIKGFASDKSKQFEPTDPTASDKSMKFEPPSGFISDKSKQFEPSGTYPPDNSKELELNDVLQSDEREESETVSNYYDNSLDSQPATTSTTRATSTKRKMKSGKNKTRRKPVSKRRYLFRGMSSNLTASIHLVVSLICVALYYRHV